LPINVERHRLVALFPAVTGAPVQAVDERARVLALLAPTSPAERDARLAARVLRLVADRTSGEGAVMGGDGWAAAVRRLLPAIDGDAEEGRHLGTILSALLSEVPPAVTMLRAALHGYADWLEESGRFEEALSVVSMLLALPSFAAAPADITGKAVQVARLRMALGEWTAAATALAVAERCACATGIRADHVRVELLKVRRLRLRGDAVAARDGLDRIGAIPAEVRAEMLLERAAVAMEQFQTSEAAEAVYRALGAATSDAQRAQALLVLGRTLRTGDAPMEAEQVLCLVPELAVGVVARADAIAELLDVTAIRGDRLQFERWWREARAFTDALTPSLVVRLTYHAAIGYARFRRPARARTLLFQALQVAQLGMLFDWMRSIELAVKELHDVPDRSPDVPAPPVFAPAFLRQVSRAVMAYTDAQRASA
jgi:hypothetical protein